VLRIWDAFGLQLWRTEAFNISPGSLLIDKICDVTGLYLAPPEHAAVFTVDEKPQIQALHTTAPVLPMLPGVPGRRSRDHIRHGTVGLLAALNNSHREGDRQAVRPPPGRGLPRLPRRHRPPDRAGPGDPRHLRQPIPFSPGCPATRD
jgi:hypothetical protein